MSLLDFSKLTREVCAEAWRLRMPGDIRRTVAAVIAQAFENHFATIMTERLAGVNREAKAWETIDEWCGTRSVFVRTRPPYRYPFDHEMNTMTSFFVGIEKSSGANMFENHYGKSRLEALESAAKWCKEEMGK